MEWEWGKSKASKQRILLLLANLSVGYGGCKIIFDSTLDDDDDDHEEKDHEEQQLKKNKNDSTALEKKVFVL